MKAEPGIKKCPGFHKYSPFHKLSSYHRLYIAMLSMSIQCDVDFCQLIIITVSTLVAGLFSPHVLYHPPFLSITTTGFPLQQQHQKFQNIIITICSYAEIFFYLNLSVIGLFQDSSQISVQTQIQKEASLPPFPTLLLVLLSFHLDSGHLCINFHLEYEMRQQYLPDLLLNQTY